MHTAARFALVFVAALNVPSIAGAAPLTWNLTSSSCSSSGSSDGNTRTCSSSPAGGPAVTASAWANTQGTTNLALETAYLEVFSGGLGIRNRDRTTTDKGETSTPQHAVDNTNVFDSVLFSFGGQVKLSSLSIGYFSGDSDVTVLAYLGGGTPVLGGSSYGALAGQGWSLVGHYANMSLGANAINAGGLTSQYWLIGAFNPTVGGNPGWTVGNDAVKFQALSGDPGSQVPEPATLALVGAGMTAFVASRRRRTGRVS
jgi:hypothetical protein